MTTPTKPYFLRPPLPGDLGWVVEQHGKIYAEEYGWDWTFEALVAGIVKEFVERFDPSGEACWIALNPQTGERLGSVFVVRSPEAPQTTAKLRMLILTPAARGMGLGGQLTDTAMQFARSKGYTDMVDEQLPHRSSRHLRETRFQNGSQRGVQRLRQRRSRERDLARGALVAAIWRATR
jgi:GNAT superfamily N-acetyltransferase